MEGTGCTCAWVHTEDLGCMDHPETQIFFSLFLSILWDQATCISCPRFLGHGPTPRETDKPEGLEPEAPSPGRLDSDHAFPGPPPFSEDRWVAITETNVCEKEGLSDLQSCPSKKCPEEAVCS